MLIKILWLPNAIYGQNITPISNGLNIMGEMYKKVLNKTRYLLKELKILSSNQSYLTSFFI